MPRSLVAALTGAATMILFLAPWAEGVAMEPPAPQPSSPNPGSSDDGQVSMIRWTSTSDWQSGNSDGLWALPGPNAGVVISRPAGVTEYIDPRTGESSTWDYATWTSPPAKLSFDATEIVPSWNAATPDGTWLSIQVKGVYTDGTATPWYTMANWTSGDERILRTSVTGQADGRSRILTDALAVDNTAGQALFHAYQLRLTLYREPGTLTTPRVWALGAMASNIPERFTVGSAAGGVAWGIELDVPRRSQKIHQGNFPQYGNGGELWCSPASTTMVMEYFGVGPSRAELEWIEPDYRDPQVAHAARMTWDYAYEGAGNWPFNTAYAASFGGLDAFVTRLRSLADLERLIAAGIPVVTSQSFLASELDGAGYQTDGHLMVVVGFTTDGDVIVNDPSSPSNDAVRRIYPREQFEQVWLRTQRRLADGTIGHGPGGIVYIIRPFSLPLPQHPNSLEMITFSTKFRAALRLQTCWGARSPRGGNGCHRTGRLPKVSILGKLARTVLRPPKPRRPAEQRRTGTDGMGRPQDESPGRSGPSATTDAGRIGMVLTSYNPSTDGDPDPGEIVWTWVPYEENDGRGKDRPVLIVATEPGGTLLAVQLSSQNHSDDNEWVPVGTGRWDGEHRASWADTSRVLRVHPDGMRREAAALDRQQFDAVIAALRRRYDWR